MPERNPKYSVNPEYERILLRLLTIDPDPMHFELLAELARTQYFTDMSNQGALSTLRKSMHFQCVKPGFYCLAGRW